MADGLDKTGQSPEFRWSAQKHRAAVLLAEDELTDTEIAETLGIARSTLAGWKQRPAFAAQIGDHIGRLQVGMLRLSIAKKRKRLEVLDNLHAKLLTVLEERAEEYDGVAAGGATGTIVRQVKQIGSGRDAQVVEEFAVDNATIRQILALEQQAAQELGQWVTKSEIETQTTVVRVVGVDAGAI